MIITATGHRPQSLGGFGRSGFLQQRLVDLARAALKKYMPRGVITGMALGWDQAVAQAATELEIPWVAAIPFQGQEERWPTEAQEKYHELLGKSTKVIVVSEGGYSTAKFHKRNEWMVDHADVVLALWNGKPSGTANTIEYAKSQGIQVINLWRSWTKYMSPPITKEGRHDVHNRSH